MSNKPIVTRLIQFSKVLEANKKVEENSEEPKNDVNEVIPEEKTIQNEESYYEYSYEDQELPVQRPTESQMKIIRYNRHNKWAKNLNVASMVIALITFMISITESIRTSFKKGYELFYSISLFVIVFCVTMHGVYRKKLAAKDPHFWNFVSLSGSFVFFIGQTYIGYRGILRLTTEGIVSQYRIFTFSNVLVMLNGFIFLLRCLVHLMNVDLKVTMLTVRSIFVTPGTSP